MIISVSRRTDIPAFYSDWFFNRLKEGYVLVRNPRGFRRVSRISLGAFDVEGFVFWTKNPAPMLRRLNELREYMYYFQFTITPYGKDIEPNLPSKSTDVISSFKELSGLIGSDRVVWRYDPILINSKYTASYHAPEFRKMAKELHNHTKKVTISFVDTKYRGLKSNIEKLMPSDLFAQEKIELAQVLAGISQVYGLEIDICAEKMDLTEYGIKPARCVDGSFFLAHTAYKKDKNQRPGCCCHVSVDIGSYNSCAGGCLYCYANYSKGQVASNTLAHDPGSPLLYGKIDPEDKIYFRT